MPTFDHLSGLLRKEFPRNAELEMDLRDKRWVTIAVFLVNRVDEAEATLAQMLVSGPVARKTMLEALDQYRKIDRLTRLLRDWNDWSDRYDDC